MRARELYIAKAPWTVFLNLLAPSLSIRLEFQVSAAYMRQYLNDRPNWVEGVVKQLTNTTGEVSNLSSKKPDKFGVFPDICIRLSSSDETPAQELAAFFRALESRLTEKLVANYAPHS